MATACGILSALLYLLPIALFLAMRATRDHALWQIALDIPLAVAIDLLSILVLTRITTLETATLISRPAWIVGSALVLVVRRRKKRDLPRWPIALAQRETNAALFAGSFTFALCSFVSRRYIIWDSQWHTSIVGSLAVQKLPFHNPLSKDDVLHYHFSGDVLASIQRTLSFDVISANAALAQAHDLMFVLAAMTLSLLILQKAKLPSFLAALAASAVLLNGPIPLLGNAAFPLLGYEYHSFITLSYRPHVALAGLLIVGILASIVIRVEGDAALETSATAPTMFACIALLAITDETSTGLLCLGLGTTWLFFPRVVGRTRKIGFVLLVLFAISIAATNLGFQASLAPGGPVHKVSVARIWRVPSLGNEFPSLPLTNLRNWSVLIIDLAPLALLWSLLVSIAIRSKTRATWAFPFFGGIVLLACEMLALRVEINHDPTEAHRFFVAPFFSLCVFAALQIHTLNRRWIGIGLLLAGLGVPAVSSIYWLARITPDVLASHLPDPSHNVFTSNCRAIAGAHFRDHIRAEYVEQSEFARFVGCRPVLSPGAAEASWTTRISPLTNPVWALRQLARDADDPDATIDAICNAGDEGSDDVVCAAAKSNLAKCHAVGTDFLSCPLDAQTRRSIR